MTAILAVAPLVGGCGLMASRDVNAALSVAARTNSANWRTATQDIANVHDRDAAKLEAMLDEKIVMAKDGPAALMLLKDYRVKKAQLVKARSAHLAIYARANDNAALMDELIGQMIAIDARFDALIGRVKPIAYVKAIAEVESRKFINAISAPAGP